LITSLNLLRGFLSHHRLNFPRVALLEQVLVAEASSMEGLPSVAKLLHPLEGAGRAFLPFQAEEALPQALVEEGVLPQALEEAALPQVMVAEVELLSRELWLEVLVRVLAQGLPQQAQLFLQLALVHFLLLLLLLLVARVLAIQPLVVRVLARPLYLGPQVL
jgi:hypothetical protein